MSSTNSNSCSPLFPKPRGFTRIIVSSHWILTHPLSCHELIFPQTKKLGLRRLSSLPSRRSVVGLAFEPRPASTVGRSRAPAPDNNLSFLFQALKRQSSLGLSFFNSILAHGDLRNNRLNQLSVNLWHLAQRHGCADTRTMVRPSEGSDQKHQPAGQTQHWARTACPF